MQAKKDIHVRCGSLVFIKGSNYRVVDFDESRVTLLNMVGSVEFYEAPANEFLLAVNSGEINIQEEDSMVSSNLSPAQRDLMFKRSEIIERLLTNSPTMSSLFKRGAINPLKNEAAKEMGVSKRRFNTLLSRYLRSGRDIYSLQDQRCYNQAGTKVQNINRKAMGLQPISIKKEVEETDREKALKYGLTCFNHGDTVSAAYAKVVKEFYSSPQIVNDELVLMPFPKEERISYKVLNAFIHKNIAEPSIKKHRDKDKNKRNVRPFTGTQQSGLTTIGQQFQIDECELPIDIVDEETRNLVVGKPIMYCVLDSFSGIIVGVYVGFKNNSNSGLFSVLLSLLESHNEELSRYKLSCTEDEFPSMVMPLEFLSDCGSEYTSRACEESMARHGITVRHAPPGTGSDKGGVENVFKRLQQMLMDTLTGSGFIKVAYDKKRNPKKEACLSIHELKRIVYILVKYLNTTDLPGYTPTKEMVEAQVDLTPMGIWKYQKENVFNPTNVTDANRTKFMFDMLFDDRTLRVDPKYGICYSGHNLIFFSDEDWFLRMISEKKPEIEIRYNPNFIDYVFVRYKKEIHKVPLSIRREALLTYKGMTWEQYDDFYKELLKCHDKDQALSKRITAMEGIDKTVVTARLLKGEKENEIKNIKENRKQERTFLESDPEEREYSMYSSLQGEELDWDEEKIDLQNQDAMESESDDVWDELSDEDLFSGFGIDE